MNINELSSREAMGLKKSYSSSVKDDIREIYTILRMYSQAKLVNVIENKNSTLLERYVAGQILAMLGDPRIATLNPQMVDIPEAEVEIGINVDEVDGVLERFPNLGLKHEWILKETPKFKTKIASFRVSKFLVTNQEYKDFLRHTDFIELPSSWEFGIYPEHKANHPVYTVSFRAAKEYVAWLSKKTERSFRLLSEVEWEYIASGGCGLEFPWGNEFNFQNANTLESGFYSSTPVGMFPQGDSIFGVSDLAGNVEEYVDDDYVPYPGSEFITDDIASVLGSYKVCRGGSFTRHADLARCTRRHGAYPKEIYVVGFRIAESIPNV